MKVLVSIVSPRYLKSEWCRRELQEFHKVATEQGGVRVGNKSRIFKVVKTPVPLDEHPAEFQSALGYNFYHADETGRFREFKLSESSPTYNQFLHTFEDLAQDLEKLLKMLDNGGLPTDSSGSNGEDVPKQKTVYLANATSELAADRDRIRRELEERGYLVLPNQELPIDGRLRETVRDYLGR